MNRSLTALFAAYEALLVVAIGVAIPLVPLTFLWAVQFGFAVDWTAFWRASADIWLLGHGVNILFTLDPTLAAALGVAGGEQPFTVTIAALGVAMLTLVLGMRAGRRVATDGHFIVGQAAAVVAFVGLSLAVTLSAQHPSARPSIVHGTVLPSLVFAVAIVIGAYRERERRDGLARGVANWVKRWPARARLVIGIALSGGLASAAFVVAIASVVTSVAIIGSYARVIALYESLHTEVLGGVTITLGQLAFLPNIVIWVASWLIGPGFAIGQGSVVGPLGTQLGPIPAIPILGGLPVGELAFGFVGLIVPVIAGFAAGAVLGQRMQRDRARDRDGAVVALSALGIGLVGGVALGLLASWSGGAAGPGRLSEVGPNPLAVGGWAAVEFAVASLIGLITAVRSRAHKAPASPR